MVHYTLVHYRSSGMIMEFKRVDGVQFFLVLSVLVHDFATPVVNWGTARMVYADGFANVRFTHTSTQDYSPHESHIDHS